MELEQCFHDLEPCDLNVCYNKLVGLENNTWNYNRYMKPKLRLYNMFKADITQEPYIAFNIPKYKRSLFAQLRGGILPLHIETGRFLNRPVDERTCMLCETDAVEDEIHFVIHCPLYDDIRSILFAKATHMFPDFHLYDELDKFVYLLKDFQKETINFIHDACQRRSSTIYTQ